MGLMQHLQMSATKGRVVEPEELEEKADWFGFLMAVLLVLIMIVILYYFAGGFK